MGDSTEDFLYRTDVQRSHQLAMDLICYGSTLLPAFDGTLANATANVLRKLHEFAPSARRVLKSEIPEQEEREKLLTANPRYKTEGHKYTYQALPIVWALNGILHANNLWINHLLDSENLAWEPTGAIHILGFGYETDQRRVEHVDLFAFAFGFLRRPGDHMREFFDRKGRG
ncbi:MAG: hypothetical protein ACXIUV_12720 [Alkalilacustris sp.]